MNQTNVEAILALDLCARAFGRLPRNNSDYLQDEANENHSQCGTRYSSPTILCLLKGYSYFCGNGKLRLGLGVGGFLRSKKE